MYMYSICLYNEKTDMINHMLLLPVDEEPDEVDLLHELLDGVLELAVAGDEGGPELAPHLPLPHPQQQVHSRHQASFSIMVSFSLFY